MKCIICNTTLTGQQQKFCSKKCKYKHENSKRTKEVKKSFCPECNRDFIINFINKKYCSKECKEKYNRRSYYQNNKDKWVKNWRDRTINRRIAQFGINEEQYNKILEDVEGRCEICNRHNTELKRSLCIDHCHETNNIRGLLCNDCNVAIGRFNDNIDSLLGAIKYLQRNNNIIN
jgi:hypothetical protein